jgi:histidyl-tRNA synthetase
MKIQAPRGMRDFTPATLRKRNYVIDILKHQFTHYGFLPIETPAMELLSSLTGKYGDEGDQLMFKVLNSRLHEQKDISDIQAALHALATSGKDNSLITERALRYDLTVPFARFVASHQHELQFPFRRYQMQPVWRADRPQKGRYREFWQCDVDSIGAKSLLNECEVLQLCDAVFERLKLPVTLYINHRQFLNGLAEAFNISHLFNAFIALLDALDKSSISQLEPEITALGLRSEHVTCIEQLQTGMSINDPLPFNNTALEAARAELQQVISNVNPQWITLQWMPVLARGLHYYTGCIFEAKAQNCALQSSILGGGRYDNLGALFGLNALSGVGLSFGLDRICDVLEELNLYPESELQVSTSRVLFTHFSAEQQWYALTLARKFRQVGIACEVYAETGRKIGKQFDFAQHLGIPWVCVIGEDELQSGLLTVKSMADGVQAQFTPDAFMHKLQNEYGSF